MVRWGNPPTQRWRCPPCGQKRRKRRSNKIGDEFGAPRLYTPEPRVVVEDTDLTLYHGDSLDVLSALPDQSVHMCATSPPFYGLRDYGVDGQIGLEETPEEWCDRLVEVFSEVRRVLRDDGTFWCEIGDSYAANRSYQVRDNKHTEVGNDMPMRVPEGLKPKDMIGQPWMLAFALRADGWYLRSEIIWSRPNPMPESIRDRPTKSHSTVFLLSKRPSYYYDMDAIREAFTDGNRGAGQGFRWNSPHYTEQEGPLNNTLGGLPPVRPERRA